MPIVLEWPVVVTFSFEIILITQVLFEVLTFWSLDFFLEKFTDNRWFQMLFVCISTMHITSLKKNYAYYQANIELKCLCRVTFIGFFVCSNSKNDCREIKIMFLLRIFSLLFTCTHVSESETIRYKEELSPHTRSCHEARASYSTAERFKCVAT